MERETAMMKQLHDAVVNYDEEKCAVLCQQVLEEGFDPYEAIMKGLAAGMKTVGDLYEANEYFVPELLLCSDALYVGLDILKPYIKVGIKKDRTRKIIMGVMEGDIHDIGKNLLKTMFEAAGWEIRDLGKDVKLLRFVEEQENFHADVVALSTLMTTSMMAMPKVIKMLKDRDPMLIVMVGGAPLSSEIAKQYGADGYADDAVGAVREAEKLIGL
jgi:methanogenic corrinoid protein MtbC1